MSGSLEVGRRQMLYDLKQRVSKQRQFTPPVAFHGSLASSQKFPLPKLTIKGTGGAETAAESPKAHQSVTYTTQTMRFQGHRKRVVSAKVGQ